MRQGIFATETRHVLANDGGPMSVFFVTKPSVFLRFCDKRLEILLRNQRTILPPYPMSPHPWLFPNDVVTQPQLNSSVILEFDSLKDEDLFAIRTLLDDNWGIRDFEVSSLAIDVF